ncbi:MAG TPA: signal peptidase II [Candidatus Omnitrophica bacterium]|nr:signal peptidase II [Candidatus Omnitrophota bacterium]
MILISICVLFLDQLTKYLALAKLSPGNSFSVIKNVFHLTLVYNSGSAFGLFKNGRIIFIFLAFFAVIFIARYLISKKDSLSISLKLPLVLIMAGAAGNLIDRIRFGYVIDFLDFRIWPVFNIADSAITIGVVLFAWYTIKTPSEKEIAKEH